MYDVPLVVQEDVPVMSVFHLEQIGDNAVGGTTLDEVSLSGKELFRVRLS